MTLAQKHYQIEAGLTQIFRITGSAEVELRPLEPIKLLEVKENTVPGSIADSLAIPNQVVARCVDLVRHFADGGLQPRSGGETCGPAGPPERGGRGLRLAVE